jgi:hypothetical protein
MILQRLAIASFFCLFLSKNLAAQNEVWPRWAIMTDVGGFARGAQNTNFAVQWTPRWAGWKAETMLSYYYFNIVRDVNRYCIECQFSPQKPSFGVWQGFIKPVETKRTRLLPSLRTNYCAFGVGVDRFHTLQKSGTATFSAGGGLLGLPSGYVCEFPTSRPFEVNNWRFKLSGRVGCQRVFQGGLISGLAFQLNVNYEKHPYAGQFERTRGKLAPEYLEFVNNNSLFFSSTGTPFRTFFLNPEIRWTLGWGAIAKKNFWWQERSKN